MGASEPMLEESLTDDDDDDGDDDLNKAWRSALLTKAFRQVGACGADSLGRCSLGVRGCSLG